MDLGHTTGRMDEPTPAAGKITKWTDLENTFFPVVKHMKDSTKMISKMDMVFLNGQMVVCTPVGGKKASKMERAYTQIQKALVARACGKTVKENIGYRKTDFIIII